MMLRRRKPRHEVPDRENDRKLEELERRVTRVEAIDRALKAQAPRQRPA